MRTSLMIVTALAVLAFAAPAQAHHVDFNKSKAACVLVNNVPTLTVDVVFVDFEESNKPVSWTISINGVADSSGSESWPATENPHVQHWTKTAVAASTSYSIVYSAHWGRGYTVSIPFETVVCPQPAPPTVQYGCTGQPIPPGTAPPVCTPPTASAPPPATPPKTKKPPKHPRAACVPYPRSRYRMINRPPMSQMQHGLTTFRVRGPQIKWVHFHVDRRFTFKDSSRPFVFSAWLWRTDIWGATLWGRHTITAKVKTKCAYVTLRMRVFNHDPPM